MRGRPPQSPTRRWSRRVVKFLSTLVVDLLASTQATFMVGLHFGWIAFLVLSVQGLLADQGVQSRALESGFIEVYGALGGFDENGRGGKEELMTVYGNVSLILWPFLVLWDMARGERSPWPLKRKAKVSAVVAAVGYSLVAVLVTLSGRSVGSSSEWLFVVPLFVVFTYFASLWAFSWAAFLWSIRDNLLEPKKASSAPDAVPLRPGAPQNEEAAGMEPTASRKQRSR